MKNMLNKQPKHTNNAGFTMVELMISTAVFSMVLLLCATAILHVGKMFYKGVTINRVQDTARLVTDDISQAIQFGAGSDAANFVRTATNGSVQAYCIGDVRYTFDTTKNINPLQPHVLYKDRPGTTVCTTADLNAPPAGGKELLGDRMRVPVFKIDNTANPSIYKIDITVSYGNDDVFAPVTPPAPQEYNKCIGGNIGGQFCAVSIINTSVVKRL